MPLERASPASVTFPYGPDITNLRDPMWSENNINRRGYLGMMRVIAYSTLRNCFSSEGYAVDLGAVLLYAFECLRTY